MSSDETAKQDAVTAEATSETPVTEVATETAASETEGETPAAIEAVAEAPVEPAAAPAEAPTVAEPDTPAETSAAAEPVAKKVQLKPTGGDDLKAVPTQDDISAAAAEMVVSPDGEVVQQVAGTPKDAAIPVEIPPEPELGDIEAEIAAAMNTETETAAKVENDPLSNELPDTGSRKEGIVQSILR